MERYEKIDNGKEEPKDCHKQPGKENKVGLGRKKDKEVKKNQTVTKTEKNKKNRTDKPRTSPTWEWLKNTYKVPGDPKPDEKLSEQNSQRVDWLSLLWGQSEGWTRGPRDPTAWYMNLKLNQDIRTQKNNNI